MQITPLDGVGAEITGIDVRDMDEASFDRLRATYAEHGVIFLRGQNMSEDDHIAFAERWGDININRFFAAHKDYPQIAMVAKEPDQKDNIGGGWHTDHSYDVEPAMGSILVARLLPDSGGDTVFASMYRAYETLDDATKEEIKDLRAVHSTKHIFGTSEETHYNQSDAKGDRIGNSDVADAMQDVVHPVIITHPLSGKKALYVNPGFTINIEGRTAEESKPLLQRLYAHAMKPEHTHRFKWEDGSVAFWDNRSTWHWALNDYQGKRRIMHRITLEGCALN